MRALPSSSAQSWAKVEVLARFISSQLNLGEIFRSGGALFRKIRICVPISHAGSRSESVLRCRSPGSRPRSKSRSLRGHRQAPWTGGSRSIARAQCGTGGYADPTTNRDGSKPLIFDRPRVDLPVEGRVAPFQPFQNCALPVKKLPVDAVVRRTGPLLVPLVDRHDRRQLKHGCQVLGREEDRPLIEGFGAHSGTLRMNRASGADHHAFVMRSPVMLSPGS